MSLILHLKLLACLIEDWNPIGYQKAISSGCFDVVEKAHEELWITARLILGGVACTLINQLYMFRYCLYHICITNIYIYIKHPEQLVAVAFLIWQTCTWWRQQRNPCHSSISRERQIYLLGSVSLPTLITCHTVRAVSPYRNAGDAKVFLRERRRIAIYTSVEFVPTYELVHFPFEIFGPGYLCKLCEYLFT